MKREYVYKSFATLQYLQEWLKTNQPIDYKVVSHSLSMIEILAEFEEQQSEVNETLPAQEV